MKNRIDLSEAVLPPVYVRNGKQCYLDPVRQKLIYIKPEETVRQKVVSYLLRKLSVPAHRISVEEPLSHYGVRSKNRADIIVLAKNDQGNEVPMAVVECKAPSVELDERCVDQMVGYSDTIGAIYLMLTNGESCLCCKWDEEKQQYIDIAALPVYSDMLEGKYTEDPLEELPERIPFEKYESFLREAWAEEEKLGYCGEISRAMPMPLASAAFNLLECLLDTRVKMPTGDYGLFRLTEDYGVRLMSYGNGSGGVFYGPYRSFLVDVNGSTEFFSLSVSAYNTNAREREGFLPKTCINVAHDNEKSSHHALQLVMDDNCCVQGNEVEFYHHGRIAVGRIGSGKKFGLMEMVGKRYPKIIDGDRFYLGKVRNDHLLRLDELKVIDLIVNLISYAIIRDEYREIVKDGKSG